MEPYSDVSPTAPALRGRALKTRRSGQTASLRSAAMMAHGRLSNENLRIPRGVRFFEAQIFCMTPSCRPMTTTSRSPSLPLDVTEWLNGIAPPQPRGLGSQEAATTVIRRSRLPAVGSSYLRRKADNGISRGYGVQLDLRKF